MTLVLLITASTRTDWGQLHWFLWAALGGAAVVVLSYIVWCQRSGQLKRLPQILLQPLPQEAPNWSFKDSWASNAGIAAVIFSGFFGSTNTLKDVFGASQASAVGAIITVSAAIGTALLVAAPLILAVTASSTRNTVIGFLIAAAATLTGIAGEVAVTVKAGETLDFGGYQHYLPWLGIVALALLAAYGFRSIPVVLTGSQQKIVQRAQAAVPRLKRLLPNIEIDDRTFAARLATSLPDIAVEAGAPTRARSLIL
jgi:hypothetical protein